MKENYTIQEFVDIELIKKSNEKFTLFSEKYTEDSFKKQLEIELLKQSNEKFTSFADKYTQEEFKKQLEIELLKQKNDSINQTLNRIETRLDSMDSRIDSHFKWTMGTILGLNIIVITGLLTALGKAFNFF